MTQLDNIEVLFYLKKESIVLCLQLENDATIFCSKYSFMSGNTPNSYERVSIYLECPLGQVFLYNKRVKHVTMSLIILSEVNINFKLYNYVTLTKM